MDDSEDDDDDATGGGDGSHGVAAQASGGESGAGSGVAEGEGSASVPRVRVRMRGTAERGTEGSQSSPDRTPNKKPKVKEAKDTNEAREREGSREKERARAHEPPPSSGAQGLSSRRGSDASVASEGGSSEVPTGGASSGAVPPWKQLKQKGDECERQGAACESALQRAHHYINAALNFLMAAKLSERTQVTQAQSLLVDCAVFWQKSVATTLLEADRVLMSGICHQFAAACYMKAFRLQSKDTLKRLQDKDDKLNGESMEAQLRWACSALEQYDTGASECRAGRDDESAELAEQLPRLDGFATGMSIKELHAKGQQFLQVTGQLLRTE